MTLIRRYPEVIILTIAAFITRVWGLYNPPATVFDEVYFKAYAGDYFSGTYYFDIHPPLGKLLLAGWAWVAHISPASLTGSDPAVTLRILPAVAGALIIPMFYAFMRSLGSSRRAATLGAALLLLDNALLVESRFILIDSMLILFGLTALTCFLIARGRSGRMHVLFLILSALFSGLAVSTKWTGLAAIGLIAVIWLGDHVRHRRQFSWPNRFTEAGILILIPLIVYMASFAVHFRLLNKTGPGDAFMSLRYQSSLIGNTNYDPSVTLSFLEKFEDLNSVMLQSERSLKTATHPYSSKWYSWPLMQRSVYFWQGPTLSNGLQGNIYLLGNPVVWWGVLVVILAGSLSSDSVRQRLKPRRFALIFLALGYLINFLPFSRIDRVMFLYHYFFALICSVAFAIILLEAMCDWSNQGKPWKFTSQISRNVYLGMVVTAVILFGYFAPLSYGTLLSPAQIEQHMWLKSWR